MLSPLTLARLLTLPPTPRLMKYVLGKCKRGAPQGLMLEPLPCNVFISDLGGGTENTRSKSVGGTNQEQWLIDPGYVTQKDIIRVEKRADENLIKFSRGQREVNAQGQRE